MSPIYEHEVNVVAFVADTQCSWYVQELPIRHVLDVMHIERNVCHSFLLYLFEDKDTIGIWRRHD